MMIEVDDHGIPPEDIRNAIIEEEGYFVLSIAPENRVKVLHDLNVALKSPIVVLFELKQRMPGNILGGTRVEMEWLRAHLAESGVQSTVSQEDRELSPAEIDLSQSRSKVVSSI